MRRKKAQSKTNAKISFLNEMNINNTRAMEEGPIKKKWTLHDLKNIKPLTPIQEDMFHAWFNNKHICAHGAAGTGKSFLALYLAFRDILDQRFYPNHIIIVRSNVATREVGHLPGTLEEKMSEYERPYKDICEELFGRSSTYEDMKNNNMIIFMPTSFVRGLTWNNAIVIVEETQNLGTHEINSIMTRIGVNTRIILTGDKVQSDLPLAGKDKSVMPDLLKIVQKINDFEKIEFTKHDIVRSDFVKSWIEAYELIMVA